VADSTALKIDVPAVMSFLVGLLNTPSPTGYHVEAAAYVRSALETLAFPGLTLTTNPKGALVATIKGSGDGPSVGMTAHMDTLGLMVKEIKGSGRLKCTRLGGLLWGGIESEGVTVRTHDNRRYRGSVVPENTSVHVNRDIGKADRNDDLMEIRLDVRTTSADETRELGIDVGDFVFVDPRVEVLDTGFIRSRYLDDKAGVAAIFGALKAIKEAGVTLPQTATILIANYEEVGHGGAEGFPADMAELLSVDMGALGQGQTGDEFSVSICVKDSGGPYHFDMNNKLRKLATEHKIPHKVDIYPFYGSDGTAYWLAGGSARVGLAGPGVDGSHAYERTHQESVEHTAHLLARYLLAPLD
jgi:putative aminopeptidase FrvX